MTQFVTENWTWLFPALVAAGAVIVKATPTKVDDAWWRLAKKILKGPPPKS